MLQVEARRLVGEADILRTLFKASRHWVSNFVKRTGLSLRQWTTTCQKLPEPYDKKIMAFYKYFVSLRGGNSYLIGQIGNADQTPVYFDMTNSTSITTTGNREVNLLSIGNEKLCFTVMLSCMADGTKLCPYIMLERKTLPKAVTFSITSSVFNTEEKS